MRTCGKTVAAPATYTAAEPCSYGSARRSNSIILDTGHALLVSSYEPLRWCRYSMGMVRYVVLVRHGVAGCEV